MPNLQNLLVILGPTQKLNSGYLSVPATGPAGGGTARDVLEALKQQFDPYTLRSNPLPGMTNQVGAPNVLLTPAWVGSLAAGQDAIFLDGVDGNLNLGNTPRPAYLFSM